MYYRKGKSAELKTVEIFGAEMTSGFEVSKHFQPKHSERSTGSLSKSQEVYGISALSKVRERRMNNSHRRSFSTDDSLSSENSMFDQAPIRQDWAKVRAMSANNISLRNSVGNSVGNSNNWSLERDRGNQTMNSYNSIQRGVMEQSREELRESRQVNVHFQEPCKGICCNFSNSSNSSSYNLRTPEARDSQAFKGQTVYPEAISESKMKNLQSRNRRFSPKTTAPHCSGCVQRYSEPRNTKFQHSEGVRGAPVNPFLSSRLQDFGRIDDNMSKNPSNSKICVSNTDVDWRKRHPIGLSYLLGEQPEEDERGTAKWVLQSNPLSPTLLTSPNAKKNGKKNGYDSLREVIAGLKKKEIDEGEEEMGPLSCPGRLERPKGLFKSYATTSSEFTEEVFDRSLEGGIVGDGNGQLKNYGKGVRRSLMTEISAAERGVIGEEEEDTTNQKRGSGFVKELRNVSFDLDSATVSMNTESGRKSVPEMESRVVKGGMNGGISVRSWRRSPRSLPRSGNCEYLQNEGVKGEGGEMGDNASKSQVRRLTAIFETPLDQQGSRDIASSTLIQGKPLAFYSRERNDGQGHLQSNGETVSKTPMVSPKFSREGGTKVGIEVGMELHYMEKPLSAIPYAKESANEAYVSKENRSSKEVVKVTTERLNVLMNSVHANGEGEVISVSESMHCKKAMEASKISFEEQWGKGIYQKLSNSFPLDTENLQGP